MATLAVVGWSALGLQFVLSIDTARSNGLSFVEATLTYFSYFTILTNLLAALSLTLPLIFPKQRWARSLERDTVTVGVAVSIAMVGLGYSLLLRHIWAPEGFQKAADITLHDLVPIFYCLYWLVFARKAGLQSRDAVAWLLYPGGYLSAILVRGSLSNRYPYHFIDASKLGYARVAANGVMLLGAFFIVGCIVIGVGRRMGRREPAPQNFVAA